VIITGAVSGMADEPWGFEYLEKRLGTHIVPLKQPSKGESLIAPSALIPNCAAPP
jgi:hypothetical protein